MFTGIVEGRGKVTGVRRGARGFVLNVEAPFDLSSDKAGDSIAVNGICLTATVISGNSFTADVSQETLSRTNLGKVGTGDAVNLERALRAGDRFGGHIVTGHIDGTGKLKKKERRGESVYLEISAGEEILGYTIEKGSIAVDGISLTVNDVGKVYFALNIIPHTMEVTTLELKKPGDTFNLEADIIGKYVEKLLGARGSAKGVDMGLLKEYGFA